MPLAYRARTSLAIAGAAATIVAALWMTPRPKGTPPVDPVDPVDPVGDDGMRVDARLISTKILAGVADHDLAVTIAVPRPSLPARPPLSVVVVIDRSGSMQGAPLRDAKHAAGRLIHQLDDGDAFAVVTYSSGDETVVAMTRATADAKRRALSAIETIADEGGTCISCGLTRAQTELRRSPIQRGVRRVVLISDGQANEGVWKRDELVQLAHDTASRGVSISAVGVGLDFDEDTMQRIANVGRGNYYFGEHTHALDAIFAHELGGLTHTVATDVSLVIRELPNVQVLEAYGYPMKRRSRTDVEIPIADLRAGEMRKVVLKVRIAADHGSLDVVGVDLGWRRASDHAYRMAAATTRVDVVDDRDAVVRSIDPKIVHAVEAARSARALEEANEVYDTHGVDAAIQVIERRGAESMKRGTVVDVRVEDLERLQRAYDTAIENLRRAPANKARKANAAKAYELAR